MLQNDVPTQDGRNPKPCTLKLAAHTKSDKLLSLEPCFFIVKAQGQLGRYDYLKTTLLPQLTQSTHPYNLKPHTDLKPRNCFEPLSEPFTLTI